MDTADNKLSVQLFESTADLQELEQQWDSLLGHSQSNTVFLSWNWQSTWAKCFLNSERRLFVVGVKKGNELLAVAPWYIENNTKGLLACREIHFIGSPESGSDYLDVIIQEGQERAVTRVIYDYLFNTASPHWDEIRFNDLPAESLFLLHFINCIEHDGKYAETKRCAYLPQTALPENPDDFLSGLSSNRRYIYRRDARRLNQEGEVKHTIYKNEDIQAGMERFFPLYDAKSGYKDGPKLYNFLSMLCSEPTPRDWVQLDILSVDDNDAAGLLHLKYGDNLAMLKMVVDKTFSKRTSVGNLLVGMSIANAIRDGISCYDFLKGDEEYKFHWAKKGRVTLSVVVSQRRMTTILSTAYRLAKYYGKQLLR